MIVLVPLELTEYDYEYNNDPRNTLHAAGPLAHRRGYSGRRLLTQVSPVALVFTTPALHALGGLSAEPYQVSSVIQWQVFHTPHLKTIIYDNVSKVVVCVHSLDGLGERPQGCDIL